MSADFDITEYAEILDVLSEGPIEGIVGGLQGVYLNDIPVIREDGTRNIQNITLYRRNGTEVQSHMSGIKSASAVTNVNSPTVEKGWTEDDGTIHPEVPSVTSINNKLDALSIALHFPTGLYGINTNKGINTDAWVTFSFEYNTASNSTYRSLGSTAMKAYDWGDMPNTAQPTLVIGQTTDIVYTGVDRNLTFGAKFVVYWNKPLAQDFCDDGFTINCRFYYPSSVTVKFEYKKHIDNVWSTFADSITLSSKMTSSSDMFSSLGYGTICCLLPDEYVSYDYRITLLSATSDAQASCYSYQRIGLASDNASGGIELSGMNLAEFKKYYYFPIPEEDKEDLPLNIRVKRLSNDPAYENTLHDARTYYSEFNVSTIESIVEEKLTYPWTALAALKFDATSYNTLPKRAYDTKLLRVKIPDNYDPIARTYTGLWMGGFQTLWSDNPAWCFYDLVTKDRYGMGQYIKIDNINKWVLYEIAQFCDELVDNGYGGQEPRYVINTYIQRQEQALTLIRNLASIFRGIIYWMDNQITCSYDHPADTVCEFTNANVIDGSFTYSGASKNTRYNTVNVSWNDPAKNYDVAIEVVQDDRVVINELRETELTALGCTIRGQARRQGKALLATERETVVFGCSLDYLRAKPGDIINIFDRYRANIKFGGRLINFESNKIFLDSPISLIDATTYTLGIVSNESQTYTRPDGVIEDTKLPKTLLYTFTLADYNNTEVSIIISGLDITKLPCNAVFTIISDDVPAQIFRVVSITEDESNSFTINAIEFNQTKQAWIDENINMLIPPPPVDGGSLYDLDEVIIHESIKIIGNVSGNVITISWGRGIGVGIGYFKVEYKYHETIEGGGTWVSAGNSYESFLDLPPNQETGYYTARVSVALTAGGILAPKESASVYMDGSDAPPSNVENFTYSVLSSGVLRLSWSDNIDFDLDHYEVQNGVIWNSTSNTKYTNIKANYLDIMDDFQSDFMIKAIDYLGNYSLTASTLTVATSSPEVSNIQGFFTVAGYRLTWDLTEGLFPLDYVSIDSSGVVVGKPTSNQFETTDLSQWTDAKAPSEHNYYLMPYDTAGNTGTNLLYQTLLPKTTVSNLFANTPFNDNRVEVSCNWTTQTFPLSYAKFYLDNEYKYNVSTENFSFTAASAGSFKIGLVLIDIATRAGTLAEYTVLVTNGNTVVLDTYLRKDDIIPSNMILQNNSLIAPIFLNETWDTHFSLRGYNTIQDQIDDLYLYYTIPESGIVTYSETYTLTEPWVATSEFTVFPTGQGGSLVIELFSRYLLGAWVQASTISTTEEKTIFSVTSNVDEIRVDYIFSAANNEAYTLYSARIIGEGL